MSLPPRFMISVYDTYPDDNSVKKVILQAQGLALVAWAIVMLSSSATMPKSTRV